jgi:hypothetical protein
MSSVARVAALIGLVFVAVIVVLDALTRSALPEDPAEAVAAWPGHPAAVIASGMVGIGVAASENSPVDNRLTAPIIGAARGAPMNIEPYLVAGVKAQTLGDEAAAGRLFEAAERRDPRAIAPHLFLSAHYAKVGQGGRSLTEFGRLLRLVPAAAAQVSQGIAASVKQLGGADKVRALVANNAELRADLMRALSADPDNLDVVLSLRTPTSANDWRPIMVQSLLSANRFEPAFALWASANMIDSSPLSRPLLFDSKFRLGLERPFGWVLADNSGGAGLVEKNGITSLHVVAFGHDTFVAASQVLLLAPGTYSLAQTARSTSGNLSSLSWRLTCLEPPLKIAAIDFGAGGVRGQLVVPADCKGQRLELMATAGDLPETLDAFLGPIDLRRLQ